MSEVRAAIARALCAELHAMGAGEVEAAVEPSGRPEFGDWSTPAALRAARVLRRSPMEIARELCARLSAAELGSVAGWTVSPPGYVNARLDDARWAPAVIGAALALDRAAPLREPGAAAAAATKTVIEHTSINTNKAAHIGHLRNAAIGDTVARLLRRTGARVEVQNYIDDTGVQVADVVVGLRELGFEPREGEPFDQFCSRVYVAVTRRYGAEPELRELTRRTLRALEERDNEVARFAKDVARRVVDAHLATMARFDIGYDLLTWESDVIELGFWRRAFELLRAAGVLVLVESGKNAGCWVMPHDEDADAGDEGDGRDAKVFVKSDGTATYTAKDVAYQLWKFGLLGLDFHYRAWPGGPPPATTVARAEEATLDGAGYGRADRVVTVIDARQAYPQRILRAAVARLGHVEAAERSVHLGYEVVALTPRAAAELGIAAHEEEGGVVALSGRRGIEVRADDLLDRAAAMVREKSRDERTAALLAAGAVRYYLLKFTLPVMIAFDFDEALRTSGDSGYYLAVAHARLAGILRKVDGDGSTEPPAPPGALDPSERTLLRRIEDWPQVAADAAAALAPAAVCAYAFELASALTDFYEHTPAIVREADPAVRRFRRALVAATKATLADVLGVLGVPALDSV